LIESVPYRRDHIDATDVEGADTSVIMAAVTAIIAIAAVTVTGSVLVDSSEQIKVVVLIGAAVSAVATSLTGADVDAGVSVGAEISSGGAVLVTGGVLGANFFSSGVDGNSGASPFSIDSFGGATLDAAFVCVGTAAGTTADEVAGASRFGMSDDAVFDTGSIISANFSSLSVLFAASGLTVSAAAAVGVGVLAGSATDAVVSKSVRTEMFLDGADSGTDGVVSAGFTVAAAGAVASAVADATVGMLVGPEMFLDDAVSDTGDVSGAGSFAILVSFVFPDAKIAAAARAVTDAAAGTLVRFEISDGVFLLEASK
jgi:hypothetical protein